MRAAGENGPLRYVRASRRHADRFTISSYSHLCHPPAPGVYSHYYGVMHRFDMSVCGDVRHITSCTHGGSWQSTDSPNCHRITTMPSLNALAVHLCLLYESPTTLGTSATLQSAESPVGTITGSFS